MDQVAQVREKIDLVSLLSEYLQVKKGGRNFKALCPFHGEKSPSFMISPERQMWHCFGCFPPGEKVKTPFGYHNIEEIDTNHWVVSGKGNIRKVTAVMQHQYDGDLVTVNLQKLKGGVTLTSDHTVFVVRGAPFMQKHYKDFSKRYRAYLKVKQTDETQYHQLREHYFPIKEVQAGLLEYGDLLLYPISRVIADLEQLDLSKYITKTSPLGSVPKKIPLLLPLNEDFLRLLGYYIAEGSSHRAYIRFSLGNHEEVFATEIVSLINNLFGLDAKIYRRPKAKKTGIEITACHAILANIFENLCGKGAANKHIPFVLQELPPEKQKILLEAIHRGDGTTFIANRSKNYHRSIKTISLVLAEQLIDILLRNNIFPNRYIAEAKIDKLQVNHKKAYSVFWSEEAKQRYSLIYYDRDGSEYWMLPIKKLTKTKYRGPVYNFTVDIDHSYVATNFAVANCGKGGDAFTFVMEYEHVEFPEALRILAQKAGVTLQTSSYDSSLTSKKETLYKINMLAAEYYHYVLTKHPSGASALNYLTGRHVEEKVRSSFKLGFAPPSGKALTQYLLRKKKYDPELLIEAGLATRRGSELYDFFRGRVIFPLFDHRDNIVGFAGRLLTASTTGPKYINTRDTLVYHKSEVFYGLNLTKEAIRRENQALLVEGEFDVLSCFQQGIANVVAVKGTALTEQHVNLLARYTQKVTMCFDGDTAGQEAMKRSLPILEKKGLQTTVVIIPEGKDPDEALQTDPVEFKQAVKKEINIYDFLLENALKKGDKHTPEGKKQISEEVLPLLIGITNEIIKEHYLKKLSSVLGTSYESVLKELQRYQRQEKFGRATPLPQVQPVVKASQEELLEAYVTALIVQSSQPHHALETALSLLADTFTPKNAYQKLLSQLQQYFASGAEFETSQFAQKLPAELVATYDRCLLQPLPQFVSFDKEQAELVSTVKRLRQFYAKQKMKEVVDKLAIVEAQGNESAIAALQREYNHLIQLLQAK